MRVFRDWDGARYLWRAGGSAAAPRPYRYYTKIVAFMGWDNVVGRCMGEPARSYHSRLWGYQMDFVNYINNRLKAVGIDSEATREIPAAIRVAPDDIIECGNQMKLSTDRNATVLRLSEVAAAQRVTR